MNQTCNEGLGGDARTRVFSRWGWLFSATASAVVTALLMWVILKTDGSIPVATETSTAAPLLSAQPAEPIHTGLTSTKAAPAQATAPGILPSEMPNSPSTLNSTAPKSTPSASPQPPSGEQEGAQHGAWPTLDDRWIVLEYWLWQPEDLAAIEGTPEGFTDYAAASVGATDDYGCATVWSIAAMHPEGFVVGGEGYAECGGATSIWSDQSGHWQQLFVTQDMFGCNELAAAGVPENSGVIECYADGQTWWY